MLQHTFSSEILMQRWRLQPKIPTELTLLSIITVVGSLTTFLVISSLFFSGYIAQLLIIQTTVSILILLILYVLHISSSWFELFVLVSEQISIISDTLRIERHTVRCAQRAEASQRRKPAAAAVTLDEEMGPPSVLPQAGNTDGYLKLDDDKLKTLFKRSWT